MWCGVAVREFSYKSRAKRPPSPAEHALEGPCCVLRRKLLEHEHCVEPDAVCSAKNLNSEHAVLHEEKLNPDVPARYASALSAVSRKHPCQV